MSSNGWYQAFPEDIQDIKKMETIEAPSLRIGSSESLSYELNAVGVGIKTIEPGGLLLKS